MRIIRAGLMIPDGKQIVIEGQRQFNYEFFPKMTSPDVIEMPFLADTYVKEDNNNPYSYVFLNTDANQGWPRGEATQATD
ncbi:hypothetical protein YC2023_099373 [Brassica napus]